MAASIGSDSKGIPIQFYCYHYDGNTFVLNIDENGIALYKNGQIIKIINWN